MQGLNLKNPRGAMKSSPGSVKESGRRAIQIALLGNFRGAILYEQNVGLPANPEIEPSCACCI